MSLNAPLDVMMYPDEKARMLEILQTEMSGTIDAHFVEYGCGGSTLMFADSLKPGDKLTSIEHNYDWSVKVQTAIDAHPNAAQIELLYHPPAVPASVYTFANPQEETPAGLHAYLNPLIDWRDVDFVLVDGIARGAVLALLAHRVQRDTRIVLHDYTGREIWYDWIVRSGLYDVERLTNMLLELRVARAF